MMKRMLLFLTSLVLAAGSMAQTQQGIVKTRGRMVNGRLQAGVGLPGATVTIEGGNSYSVQKTDGGFSFPVPLRTFLVKNVQKKGYELVDAEVMAKTYHYSQNPFYIVMDTPEQMIQDKLAAERKLRRTLQNQLQQREDEIEALNVDLAEKQRLLEQLYEDQQNNQALVAGMAKRFSTLDYDQLDDFYSQVCYFIEEGHLTRADSLLRSRGDLNAQVSHIISQGKAIDEQRQQLKAAETVQRSDVDEAARRCYCYYESFLAQYQADSAAHYLALRASLDSTNVDWGVEAAAYLVSLGREHEAEPYYQRLLAQFAPQGDGPSGRQGELSQVLNNYAVLCQRTGRAEESESMFQKAIALRRRLAAASPSVYNPYLAQTLNNLAVLYYSQEKLSDCSQKNLEALAIRRQLAQEDAHAYAADLAVTLNNQANVYLSLGRFDESEACYKEALNIYSLQSSAGANGFTAEEAAVWNNLASLYYQAGQMQECREAFREAIRMYSVLSKHNPYAYKPILDNLVSRIGKVFTSKEEKQYLERVNVYRILVEAHPVEFAPHLATGLGNLSYYAILEKHYEQAESYAREGLATDSTKHFIYANLVASLLFQKRYAEAEKLCQDYKNDIKYYLLTDFQTYQEKGVVPPGVEADVERIRKLLDQ